MGFWVGVASREHVLVAVTAGFCQFNHGKEAPLRRLKPGNRLIYYSPRDKTRDGEFLQALPQLEKCLRESRDKLPRPDASGLTDAMSNISRLTTPRFALFCPPYPFLRVRRRGARSFVADCFKYR